jgi:hypothetical protein
MRQPFRHQWIVDHTSQNQSILRWFPYYDAVPPYDSAAREVAIKGHVTGVTVRRSGSNYTVSAAVVSIYDDLTATPAGIGGTGGRRLHKSASYAAPAASSTEPFHDVRFDPEYFSKGFWVLLDLTSSAGSGTDQYYITVQGEVEG